MDRPKAQSFYNIAAEPESLLLHLFLSCLRRQGERLGKMAQARKQEKEQGRESGTTNQ